MPHRRPVGSGSVGCACALAAAAGQGAGRCSTRSSAPAAAGGRWDCSSHTGSRSWRAVWDVRTINKRTSREESQPRSAKIGTFPDMNVAQARKLALTFVPPVQAGSRQRRRAHLRGDGGAVAAPRCAEARAQMRARDAALLEGLTSTRCSATCRLPRSARRMWSAGCMRWPMHGAPMADVALRALSGVFKHYGEKADDDWRSPIARGLKADRRDAKERQRKRILTDDEIRALWQATETNSEGRTKGRHGRLQRAGAGAAADGAAAREGAGDALVRPRPRQGRLDDRGTETREKHNAEVLRLPPLAQSVLDTLRPLEVEGSRTSSRGRCRRPATTRGPMGPRRSSTCT